MIVNVLKDFKSQAQLWEQLKEAQPKAYKTMTGVLQAMIALARQVYGEGGGEQKEEPTQKSEAPLVSPLAPAMHATVEGFLTQLKGLPKVGPERGKLITSHMNHGPFLSALQTHPQGKQVHTMLTQFLNSKANAGIGVGAHAMAKKDLMPGGTADGKPDKAFNSKQLSTGQAEETEEHGLDAQRAKEIAKDHLTNNPQYYKKGSLSMIHHALKAGKTGRHQVVLPIGSQIDGAPSGNHKAGQIKVADPATGQSKWRSVRAGQVMAPDGTPTSSRNPSGGQ